MSNDFSEVVKALSSQSLKNAIVKASSNIKDIEDQKKADDKLNELKEMVKELSAPYNDGIKNEKIKIKALLEELETRGEKLENIEKPEV